MVVMVGRIMEAAERFLGEDFSFTILYYMYADREEDGGNGGEGVGIGKMVEMRDVVFCEDYLGEVESGSEVILESKLKISDKMIQFIKAIKIRDIINHNCKEDGLPVREVLPIFKDFYRRFTQKFKRSYQFDMLSQGDLMVPGFINNFLYTNLLTSENDTAEMY